jgi:Ca2+-binding EF-hand superfamily protein
MKRLSIIAVSLFVLILPNGSFAQNPDPQTPRGGRRQQGRRSLPRMDKNNDGRISRDEWNRKPERFDKLDKNGDGYLDREEAVAAGRAHARRALKQMDVNNDDRVTRDEWKGDPQRFDHLDSNRDGVITQEEFAARKSRRSQPSTP